jgi:glutathione peroxidase
MAEEDTMKFCRFILTLFVISIPLAVASANPASEHKSVYDFGLVGLDGKEVSLSIYKGKVLLIVNLASKSIYSKQIQSLNDLQKTYSDKGLIVIGIPSADFGSEEAEDSAALKRFYSETEHVNFSVYSKATLRGKNPIPLIHFLTDPKDGTGGGDLHWNFTKFIVNREGKAILRFEADSDPADPEFHVKIEQVLDGSYKKAPDEKNAPKAAGDDEDSDDGE